MMKAMETKAKFNGQNYLFFMGRAILGGVFVYASIDKILNPLAFAEAVYNYQILPGELTNITAIILPWLELMLGGFLIAGIWLPGSVLISNVLLVGFFGALLFNLARGLDIHCGCFSTSQQATGGYCICLYVIRDGMFLIVSLYLFFRLFLGKQQGTETQTM